MKGEEALHAANTNDALLAKAAPGLRDVRRLREMAYIIGKLRTSELKGQSLLDDLYSWSTPASSEQPEIA